MTAEFPEAFNQIEKEYKQAWVPLRSNGFGVDHPQHFGNINWEPNKIPHAKELEINIEVLSTLLKRFGIAGDVTICNYSERNTDSSPSIRSNHNGEAVMGTTYQPIKKPKLGNAIISEQGTINLEVNFDGWYRFLEGRIPGGRNNPKFEEHYGKAIDNAIKGQFGNIITKNFMYRLKHETDDPKLALECLSISIVGLMEILSISIGSSLLLLEGKINELPQNIATSLIVLYELYFCVQSGFILGAKLRERKDNKLQRESPKFVKDINEIIPKHGISSLLYPQEMTKSYFGPQFKNLFIPKDLLIRGRKN